MCVVSMIFDHYHDKWQRLVPQHPWWPNVSPPPQPAVTIPWMPNVDSTRVPITPAEIDEFRKLLERAREYDKRNNEPDCELEEKKNKVRELAEQLGVKIDFL